MFRKFTEFNTIISHKINVITVLKAVPPQGIPLIILTLEVGGPFIVLGGTDIVKSLPARSAGTAAGQSPLRVPLGTNFPACWRLRQRGGRAAGAPCRGTAASNCNGSVRGRPAGVRALVGSADGGIKRQSGIKSYGSTAPCVLRVLPAPVSDPASRSEQNLCSWLIL